MENKKEERKQLGYSMVFQLFTPMAAFYICESLQRDNIFELGINAIFGNFLIYAAIYSGLKMIFRKTRLAAGALFLLTLGFAAANYYVCMFRGTPIALTDILFAWKTAAAVAGGYMNNFRLTREVVFSVAMAALWIWLSGKAKGEYRFPRERLTFGICALAAVTVLTVGGFLAESFEIWDITYNNRKYGLMLNLASQAKQLRAQEPEGYQPEELEKLAARYGKRESGDEKAVVPDIIAIMNESFADLESIREFETSEPCLEYYHQLKENTVKGKAYVSIFGGATCNTEYEFLTGNSLALLPWGSLPFQQYVKEDSYSIAALLGERGYETIGIHPYYKASWNRDTVYKNLGFHQFIGLEDFNSTAETERGIYISDKESYEMVIQKYEEVKASGKPAFIFNVTIQNHGGYQTNGYSPQELIKITEAPGAYPDAEEYLTLLNKSDEAIKVLIDYFKDAENPVAVIFFGDHHPGLSDDFYDFLYGKSSGERTREEEQEKYQIPFFIWTNYEIEEQENVVTSTNFLSEKIMEISGAELSPYMEFLKQVQKEIPVMNNRGYMNSEYEWRSWSEEAPQILQDYEKIQYNRVFDGGKRIYD